jgi:23S rRNA pseudouridine2605 synthase
LLGPETVLLDGRLISFEAEGHEPVRAVLAYHKPVGEIATKNDPGRRKTVFEALPPAPVGRWISVGRLDINTSGLLLFTTDGELAHRLMHPRYQLDREYAVRVRGALSDSQHAALLNGVTLEDGAARFLSVAEMNQGSSNSWYQVRLREGRNREVRSMFEAIDVVVSRLIRTRYGPIELGRTRRGDVRSLDHKEIDELYRAADPEASSVRS